ncbi:MAG: deoxyribonuclease IV [Patescibacteria group bacterium]|jgi:deoxyribonuclease-4
MKFGAHVSAARPFSEAIKRASDIGCECMQIFLNAPQRWNPVIIPDEEMERFVEMNQKAKVSPIISHSIYLISLSGNNPFYYEASQKSLIDELEKGKRLGLLGVNTHLGSSNDKTFEDVAENVAGAIRNILDAVPDGPDLIIENSAGSGNVIGDEIEEIGEIIKSVRSPRLKILIDTAHAFESGYALHTKNGLDEFVDKIDKLIGIERLVGLHINDSATPFNSKRDRHADIGMGEMGLEAFGRIVSHPKLRDLFGIIETPSLKGKGDAPNLEILRSL